jgi:hypothetical protein
MREVHLLHHDLNQGVAAKGDILLQPLVVGWPSKLPDWRVIVVECRHDALAQCCLMSSLCDQHYPWTRAYMQVAACRGRPRRADIRQLWSRGRLWPCGPCGAGGLLGKDLYRMSFATACEVQRMRACCLLTVWQLTSAVVMKACCCWCGGASIMRQPVPSHLTLLEAAGPTYPDTSASTGVRLDHTESVSSAELLSVCTARGHLCLA